VLWVEGMNEHLKGGSNRRERMRRVMVALLSAVVAGLMLVPGGVSAGAPMVVEDSVGDLGIGVNTKTSEIARPLPGNVPVAEATYLDIHLTWLTQEDDTYSFGMELASELPEAGTALPKGVKLVEWAMWIDPSPYHVTLNPVAPLFLIALRYDGSSYSAFILDYGTMVTTALDPSVGDTSFELEFSAASIDDLESKWWSPLVRAWWGTLGSAGYWFLDAIDFGTAPGQEYYDLPWPPV
jgi:hypothetical protein